MEHRWNTIASNRARMARRRCAGGVSVSLSPITRVCGSHGKYRSVAPLLAPLLTDCRLERQASLTRRRSSFLTKLVIFWVTRTNSRDIRCFNSEAFLTPREGHYGISVSSRNPKEQFDLLLCYEFILVSNTGGELCSMTNGRVISDLLI